MNVKLTRTSGGLEAAITDLNKALTKANKGVGRTAAGVGRRVILEQAKKARGTLTMSKIHVSKGYKFAKLGAKVKRRPNPTGETVLFTAVPAGPWAITEFGTAPHVIRARVKDGLKVNNAVYDEVNHPGARGFHIWDKATAGGGDSEIERAIAAVYDRQMNEAMGD